MFHSVLFECCRPGTSRGAKSFIRLSFDVDARGTSPADWRLLVGRVTCRIFHFEAFGVLLGTTCHLFCLLSLPLFVEVLFLMGYCGPLGFFFSVVPPSISHAISFVSFCFSCVCFSSGSVIFGFQYRQICLFCDGLVDCCFDPSTGLVSFLFERWLNGIGLYCHCLRRFCFWWPFAIVLQAHHVLSIWFCWALLLLHITYFIFHCHFVWSVCYLCYSLVLFQLWLWSWYGPTAHHVIMACIQAHRVSHLLFQSSCSCKSSAHHMLAICFWFVWLHHSSRDVAQTLVIDIFSWSGKFYHWNLSVSVLFLFLCCCLWTLWFNEIFFQRDIFSEWYF